MRPRRIRQYGFSLIELLVASSIASMAMLAIALTFASGLKVFYTAQRYGSGERTDTLLALEKIARDIRNNYAFTGLDFSGKSDKIIITGIIAGGSGSLKFPSPGIITYYLKDGQIIKEEKAYPQATSRTDTSRGRLTNLCPAQTLSFAYYDYDRKTGVYSWQSSWSRPKEESAPTDKTQAPVGVNKDTEPYSPMGVRIKLVYKDNEAKEAEITRTIFIPAAVSIHRAYMSETTNKVPNETPAK